MLVTAVTLVRSAINLGPLLAAIDETAANLGPSEAAMVEELCTIMGTLNASGTIDLVATKEVGWSTLAQICEECTEPGTVAHHAKLFTLLAGQ